MTSDAPASDRILGTFRSEDGEGIARMEDRFDAGVDELWSALTEPRRLARWYGEVDGDLRVGGEFRVRIALSGERTGQVDACEPRQRLLLTMRDPDAQPGQPEQTVIEAQLSDEGGQTVLVVEVRNLPLQLLAAYGTGVQIHLEHLADHIYGRESDDAEGRWERLFPSYEARAAKIN